MRRILERVHGGFNAEALELLHHFGATDLEGILLALDEDRRRHTGADVRDGRRRLVDLRLVLRTGTEEEHGTLIRLGAVGSHQILSCRHHDAGFHRTGLILKRAFAFKLRQTSRHRRQTREMTSGGSPHAADALGIELQFFGMSPQTPQRCFAVMQRRRILGLGGEAIRHQRGYKSTLRQALHHRFIGLDLTRLPATAVNIQDARPHPLSIRHINQDLHRVLRILRHLQGLERKTRRCLGQHLLPLGLGRRRFSSTDSRNKSENRKNDREKLHSESPQRHRLAWAVIHCFNPPSRTQKVEQDCILSAPGSEVQRTKNLFEHRSTCRISGILQ